jgi:xylulokinase
MNPGEPTILACDLGTGGSKAALFAVDGRCLAQAFVSYPTTYPRSGWHEQCPEDWWSALVGSVRQLLTAPGVDPRAVACLGLSGHSLGAAPVDCQGSLLRQSTPIWSDSRAGAQAARFFTAVPEEVWYTITGNGFPAPLYPVFKALWYREHEPEMFGRISRLLGTKDYVNYRLSGVLCTDYSYASGSGIYDLLGWGYSPRLLEASGLPAWIFPEIAPSSEVIGGLLPEAAGALGLPPGTPVVAGGVDNACMALGARCLGEGRVYNSQGSSSWIAVSSARPLLDVRTRPFVFTHVVPGQFTSAIGVFSTGSSLRWLRDAVCPDLARQAEQEGRSPYELMTELAAGSPPGANGLLFHPNLAGGSSIDPSPNLRGAFLGLDLRHSRADLVRAALEGIALQQRLALDVLRSLAPAEARPGLGKEMLVVGGGSRSPLWRQIHADVYNLEIVKTNVDQDAAALGAAALAAVGSGLWKGFEKVVGLHRVEATAQPVEENVRVYERILPIFRKASESLSELGEMILARAG